MPVKLTQQVFFQQGFTIKKLIQRGQETICIQAQPRLQLVITGWLLTAKSTLGPVIAQTNQFHPSFVLGSVIRGWQWRIPEIKQGGAITLFLPSRYAYGPFPQPDLGLPANAVLVFHIMLYNVTN